MEVDSRPYIVAVSGGIDSMVLLDMMQRQNIPVVVAHVNHGIRSDGEKDRQLVQEYARAHNLPFEYVELELGPGASEMTARQARYAWLRKLQARHRAQAILTAHHVDDLIETILINIGRGTGWRGLCSLRSSGPITRPLLGIGMRKADVVRYAIDHDLNWREDETNDDVRYKRNYLRHGRAAQLDKPTVEELLALHLAQCQVRELIEHELDRLITPQMPLPRYPIIMADNAVAEELLRHWLGESKERQVLRKMVHFAKTTKPHTKLPVGPSRFIEASKRELFVSRLES